MSCFVSPYRSAETNEDELVANFEDEFGSFSCEEINRLLARHASCGVLPSTDEHSRMKQKILDCRRSD